MAVRAAASAPNRPFSKVDEFDEGSVVPQNEKAQFKNGLPVYKGEVTACFDDGLLFRVLETQNNNRWSFYNDTIDLQMRVQCTFGEGSTLKALENTVLEEMPDGSFRATVTVYPLETELFLEGTPNGYSSNIKAIPLTEAYLKDMARQDSITIAHETSALTNLVGKAASIDETVLACVNNNVKFIDFTFPPDQKTIQIGSLIKMKYLPWERPCMYLSDENAKQARLFRNGVHPCNIDPGDLGDSWLTGAMACIAEFPDRIRDMFRHPESVEQGQKERANGVYRVTINRNGWWTNVIVDDFLPCAGGRPKYAHSKGDTRELWVSIMEKAYAKLFGGYGFIIAGDPLHALQDLSGFPCSSFDNLFMDATMDDTYELFEHILTYFQKGFLPFFATPTRDAALTSRGAGKLNSIADADAFYEKAKLKFGMVYAVLKIRYFPEMNLRLLQLRNPWGTTDSDWNGPWNKKDENWSKYSSVKEAMGYNPEDDGTFYIDWEDLKDFFVSCGVCFVQHPCFDYRVRGTFFANVPTTCLEIYVRQPVVMNITLSQDDRRGTDKVDNSPIMISIAHGCGGLSPMHVDLNSAFDADHPTGDFTFCQSRDVSMFYEFLPENSPYLIVPRSMTQYAKLPYTFGIISPVEIGKESSDVRVAFRALAAENRIFDNFQKFNCETVSVETEFQTRDPNQFFPDVYLGTIIQTSE